VALPLGLQSAVRSDSNKGRKACVSLCLYCGRSMKGCVEVGCDGSVCEWVRLKEV